MLLKLFWFKMIIDCKIYSIEGQRNFGALRVQFHTATEIRPLADDFAEALEQRFSGRVGRGEFVHGTRFWGSGQFAFYQLFPGVAGVEEAAVQCHDVKSDWAYVRLKANQFDPRAFLAEYATEHLRQIPLDPST